jgi:hypothetical protein
MHQKQRPSLSIHPPPYKNGALFTSPKNSGVLCYFWTCPLLRHFRVAATPALLFGL